MGAVLAERDSDIPENTPITVYPPGRRSRNIVERKTIESPIRILTETALVSPGKARLAPPAAGDRRTAQERVEAAQRAEALSVALSQPGREGRDDPMLTDPLGRFCYRWWPPRISNGGEDLNTGHRKDMYKAGQLYAIIVHQHRVLLGLGVGATTRAEGLSVTLTDAEMRAQCEAARIKRDAADDILRAIFSGAISAMMRVAVEEMDPTPTQEDLVAHSLWALSVHFGIVRRGIHSEKGC